MSCQGQASRKLRIQSSHKRPEQPLTVGGIVLREPVEIDRIGQRGRWIERVDPSDRRGNVE